MTDEQRERIRRSMRDVLETQMVKAEIEELERAVGWVVVSKDLEFDRFMVIGSFVNPGDALAYASSYGAEVNREFPEGNGWQVDVHPVMPADPMHVRRDR